MVLNVREEKEEVFDFAILASSPTIYNMPEIRNIQVKTTANTNAAYDHLNHNKQSLRFNSIKVATTVKERSQQTTFHANPDHIKNGTLHRLPPNHMPPIPPTLKRPANFNSQTFQKSVKKRVQIKLPPRVMTVKNKQDIR